MPQLASDKHSAERTTIELLKQAKAAVQKKIAICDQRYDQTERIAGLWQPDTAKQTDCKQDRAMTYADIVSSNDEQLSACREAVLALRATKEARLQLQKCLDEEEAVLNRLQKPMQACIANTRNLIGSTAGQFRSSDPQRDKRHAEMLVRWGLLTLLSVF